VLAVIGGYAYDDNYVSELHESPSACLIAPLLLNAYAQSI
jgi:hypothetical protein